LVHQLEEAERQQRQQEAQAQRERAEERRRRAERQREEQRQWEEHLLEEQRRSEENEMRRRQEEEESIRRQRELEEAERLNHLPHPCTDCKETGQCGDCDGKGVVAVFILAPQVSAEGGARGKLPKGCTTCGGFGDGTFAEWKPGTGLCPVCKGKCKVWPGKQGWKTLNSSGKRSNLRRFTQTQRLTQAFELSHGTSGCPTPVVLS